MGCQSIKAGVFIHMQIAWSSYLPLVLFPQISDRTQLQAPKCAILAVSRWQ